MSFHVKDDFRAGDPITAVGAEWFNSVAAFLNNLVGVDNVTVTKPATPSPSAPVTIEASQSGAVGTPTVVGESATNEVTQADDTLWRSGGADGATLLMFYKSSTESGVDKHKLYAAKLTISSDGRIVGIQAAQNGGIQFPRETAPSILKTITQNSGYHYGPEDQSIPNPTSSNNHMKTDTWTRGDVDGSNRRQGVKVPVFTRCVDGGTKYYLMFRELTFDSLGRLTNVSKELGSYNIEGL